MGSAEHRSIVAVVGPTASGKTALSLDIAEEFGGEIVNADAMQLYRGMDIGTAKLPVGERRGIPHHQIDVLDISEEASVAAYQRSARADIAAIRARSNVPVVVGGSGLYVRALLDEMEFPGTDPEIRARIEKRAADLGSDAVYRELAARDPRAAANIEPANVRRVVRALEVIELTGRPFTATLPTNTYVEPVIQVALDVGRDELRARIETRVNQMIADGFVDEVASLPAPSATARGATGYPEMRAYLAGEMSLSEARDATVRATQKLAKRQMTWFRRDGRIAWFESAKEAFSYAVDSINAN